MLKIGALKIRIRSNSKPLSPTNRVGGLSIIQYTWYIIFVYYFIVMIIIINITWKKCNASHVQQTWDPHYSKIQEYCCTGMVRMKIKRTPIYRAWSGLTHVRASWQYNTDPGNNLTLGRWLMPATFEQQLCASYYIKEMDVSDSPMHALAQTFIWNLSIDVEHNANFKTLGLWIRLQPPDLSQNRLSKETNVGPNSQTKKT